MASKYLSGTASYAANTRTITGASMSTALDSTDVGRAAIFRIGTGVYFSRVSTVLSASSCSLHVTVTLPLISGTVDDLIVLDQGEKHTYQDYVDSIDVVMKADAGDLTNQIKEDALMRAVTDYGNNASQTVAVSITGNGTSLYSLSTVLGAWWKPHRTVIYRIEYPIGQMPPEYLDAEDWQLYDDGTAQDGSNIKLMLNGITPTASETFVVELQTEFSLTIAGQNFADTQTNFAAITTLAGAYAAFSLAAFYAPSSSSTISADVVNYSEKSDKYLRLGRELLKRYNEIVFGSADGAQIQAAAKDVDVEGYTQEGDTFLFHSRR